MADESTQETVSKQQFEDIIQSFTQKTEALNAQLQEGRVALAKLEGRADALAQPKQPEKRWTRQELQPKIDDGTMTEAEASEILLNQRERDLETRLEEKYQAREEQRSRDTAVEAKIAAYTARIPTLLDKNSEDFKKVKTAFEELVASGSPSDSKATEVAALRIAFGPAEKLPDRTAKLRETHEETGGAGAGSEKGEGEGSARVPQKYRAHYQHMIDLGHYKDWNDPAITRHLEYMRK